MSHIKEIMNFKDFGELFEAAIQLGVIDSSNNMITSEILYHYQFNSWLCNHKNCDLNDIEHYLSFLNINTLKEYLNFESQEVGVEKFLSSISDEEAFSEFMIQHNALRSKFRVKRRATKFDCEQMPRLKEGDVISFEPEYKTSKEAYILLTEYYARCYLELEKSTFKQTYKVVNSDTIMAEISEIERFISTVENISLSQASKAYAKHSEDSTEFVYKRLKAGFYEFLEIEKYPWISSIGNVEAMVYGRFFLFYDFLKSALQELSEKEWDWGDFLEKQTISSNQNLNNGFSKLEKYINDYVYQDMKTNLDRLNQIKRNLMSWKEQLYNAFINPENAIDPTDEYRNRMKMNAERMRNKIIAALSIIESRISSKSGHDNFSATTFAITQSNAEYEKHILKKGIR
ncbi:hypothetical protein [Paraflavitalea soli]|nr:hypothetical protein [Paraflavitalea soli]